MERLYNDEPDCAPPDEQGPFDPLEQGTDVISTENHLVTLPKQIVIEAVRQVIKMLSSDIFREDIIHNHITDWTECMSIVDKTLDRSLMGDGFQKMKVP